MEKTCSSASLKGNKSMSEEELLLQVFPERNNVNFQPRSWKKMEVFMVEGKNNGDIVIVDFFF